MATPSSCSIISVITEALPLGLMFAQTFSTLIPTRFAMARAVGLLSPVIMNTSIPIELKAMIAWMDDGFGLSHNEMARTGIGVAEGDDAIDT